MKTLAFQKKGPYAVPYTVYDQEAWAEYIDNQIVKARITGFKKQRSVEQLGLLMACIKEVSANTENENWNTPKRAKLSLKALLGYVDDTATVVVDNRVVVQYDSFSFDRLGHMEACGLFDKAFPLLAGVIGLTEDELIHNAKSKMLSY